MDRLAICMSIRYEEKMMQNGEMDLCETDHKCFRPAALQMCVQRQEIDRLHLSYPSSLISITGLCRVVVVSMRV